MSRSVSPVLLETMGHLLAHQHLGAQNAVTWERLRDELRAHGIEVNAVRRLQEARDVLRERGLPVVGTSDRGVFLASTEDERAEAASEIRKRIASLTRALATVDEACAGRIQLALFGGAARSEGGR